MRATNLEKMFLQGSGYAKVPNSVMTMRFSVMALTYASVLINLERKDVTEIINHDKVFQNIAKQRAFKKIRNMKATGAEDEKLLLSVVGDLAVLEVKFVHKGLTIKKVVKGFVPDLKKPRTQTEETPLQKCRNPAYKKSQRTTNQAPVLTQTPRDHLGLSV